MAEKQTLRPSPTAILNPRLDVNFKAIFTQGTKGSDIALRSFLSSVLERKIKSLALAPNEPAADLPGQMQMFFDVAVTFDDGEQADIEMQGRDREYDFGARAEIQAARLLNNNAKKGGNYKAKKVYQISVLNFHYKNNDKNEMSWYTMKSESGDELADRLNVIFIDLPTIKRLVGMPAQKLTPLQKWGLYLSYADDESKRGYINQIAQSEGGIMEADRIAQTMSQEDANWFRQNSIDIFWRDYNAEKEAAIEKSIEQGLQQGLEQGLQQGLQQGARQKALETAKKLLADKKYSAQEIAELLQIPVEEFAEQSAV